MLELKVILKQMELELEVVIRVELLALVVQVSLLLVFGLFKASQQ